MGWEYLDHLFDVKAPKPMPSLFYLSSCKAWLHILHTFVLLGHVVLARHKETFIIIQNRSFLPNDMLFGGLTHSQHPSPPKKNTAANIELSQATVAAALRFQLCSIVLPVSLNPKVATHRPSLSPWLSWCCSLQHIDKWTCLWWHRPQVYRLSFARHFHQTWPYKDTTNKPTYLAIHPMCSPSGSAPSPCI